MKNFLYAVIMSAATIILACGNYTSARAAENICPTTRGTASYYGKDFHGRKTATGERFDRHGLTAAHRTLPLGTQATVTNMENGKKVDVEINDRGPYARGRTIDLAEGAAKKIDLEKEDGLAKVKIEPHKTVVVEKEGDTKIVCQNK